MVAALAGAIAISAMVLPGISGSLVLILLGQYYEIISAISALRAPTIDIVLLLAAFGIGMAAGLPLFARLVGFVLQRFHDQTMAFLTGLMVGSLYALWPFKRTEVLDLYARVGERITLVRDTLVHTNRNALPGGLTEALLAALFCLAGIGCMAFFVRREIEAGEKASS
jgi:putative membrane protein